MMVAFDEEKYREWLRSFNTYPDGGYIIPDEWYQFMFCGGPRPETKPPTLRERIRWFLQDLAEKI